MPSLFEPYTLKGVTLRNRIVASPMCQYQAVDGFPGEWHQSHYTMLARGGVGLLIVEATGITPEGRVTPDDLGLWSDAHAAAFEPIVRAIKKAGAVPGIQLGHAGRKASCTPPWEGSRPLEKDDPRAWEPVAPSARPYLPGSSRIPRELTRQEILGIQEDFAKAARRAAQAGFEWLELHFAHGFLAQSFLSRQANVRTDAYGGALENRARFLIETVSAVRKAWPEDLPLTIRLGVVEFGEDAEHSFREAIQVLRWLKAAGLDLVDVGLALTTPDEPVPWGPNFMVPYADRVRAETGLPVLTSWFITRAQDADAFLREARLDLVAFARTLLANPHWTYQAARDLGLDNPAAVLPTPYAYWLQNW